MEVQEVVITQNQFDTLILKLSELVQGINDVNNTLPNILTYIKVIIVLAGIVISFIIAYKLVNIYVMGWVRYFWNKFRI